MRGSVIPLRQDLVLVEIVWEPEEPEAPDIVPAGPSINDAIDMYSKLEMINARPALFTRAEPRTAGMAIGRVIAVKKDERQEFNPDLFDEDRGDDPSRDSMVKMFKELFGQMTERSRGVSQFLNAGDLVLFSRYGTAEILPAYLEGSEKLRLIGDTLIFAKIEAE